MSHAVVHNHAESDDKVQFGFWLYLMTDCILFASLFAVYVVQLGATAGGPSGRELFDLPFVLLETLILLTSSLACGMMILATKLQRQMLVVTGLVVTLLLGAAFLALELTEFNNLISEGYGWQRSGFLTAFFTLVGTHGLHISIGLLWIGVMIYRVLRNGVTASITRKLTLLSIFWHFLDVIWIFIFTIVYLIGAM